MSWSPKQIARNFHLQLQRRLFIFWEEGSENVKVEGGGGFLVFITFASSFAGWEYKGMFRLAYILQKVVLVRRVFLFAIPAIILGSISAFSSHKGGIFCSS